MLGVVFVALLVAWLVVNLVKTPSDFFTVMLIGITTGSVYALIALGYTLVYGILQLINFAHGDVFALCGLFCQHDRPLPPWLEREHFGDRHRRRPAR